MREENLGEKGNIRDQATLYQLLVLANMESYNAILIKQGKAQNERTKLLRKLTTFDIVNIKLKYVIKGSCINLKI